VLELSASVRALVEGSGCPLGAFAAAAQCERPDGAFQVRGLTERRPRSAPPPVGGRLRVSQAAGPNARAAPPPRTPYHAPRPPHAPRLAPACAAPSPFLASQVLDLVLDSRNIAGALSLSQESAFEAYTAFVMVRPPWAHRRPRAGPAACRAARRGCAAALGPGLALRATARLRRPGRRPGAPERFPWWGEQCRLRRPRARLDPSCPAPLRPPPRQEALLLQTLLERDSTMASLATQLLKILHANMGWLFAAWWAARHGGGRKAGPSLVGVVATAGMQPQLPAAGAGSFRRP
jgi:hypothetical protein